MDYTAEQVVATLTEAAELNRQDQRDGNVLVLPDYGQVVMTGDLHGNLHNFRKLRAFAALGRCPARHVVLHELLHCVDGYESGRDESCRLLLEAGRWKEEFPDQVHFILGNHCIAQVTGREISKGGGGSVADFNRSLVQRFGDKGESVHSAVCEFLRSCALAARTPNRIFLSHSLPSPENMERFDPQVLHRPIEDADLMPEGQVYMMLWGRGQTAAQLQRLAETFDVDFFITGHQPQETGFSAAHGRHIILSSEHSQGCFLPIDLSKRYSFDELVARIRKFTEVPVAVD